MANASTQKKTSQSAKNAPPKKPTPAASSPEAGAKTTNSSTSQARAASSASANSLLNSFLLAVLASGLMLFGLAYYWPQLQPRYFPIASGNATPSIPPIASTSPVSLNADDLAEVQRQIASLQQRIAQNETEPSVNAPAANNSALQSRLDALESQIAQLQPVATTADETDTTADEISRLQQELELVKQLLSQQIKQQSSQPSIDVRLFAAFNTLQLEALSGRPFEQSLANFRSVALDDTMQAALNALAAYASTGRPSAYALVTDFQQRITQTAPKETDQQTLQERMLENLRGFITIRRTDGQGNDNEAVIAQIERALTAQQWYKAGELYSQLPEATQQTLAPWYAQLVAYQQIPQLLNDLQLALGQLLNTPSDEGVASDAT